MNTYFPYFIPWQLSSKMRNYLISCFNESDQEVIDRVIQNKLDGNWTHINRRHSKSSSQYDRKSDKFNTDDTQEMKRLVLKALLSENKRTENNPTNNRLIVYADLSPEVTGNYKGRPLTRMKVVMNRGNNFIVSAHPSRK